MAIGNGGLGGLGGVGTSYPARFGAPQSQAVDYVPDADTWMNEWQKRYDAEAARRGQGARPAGPSHEEYVRQQLGGIIGRPGGNVTWQPSDLDKFTSHLTTGGSMYYGDSGVAEDVARFALGDSTYNQLRNYRPSPGSPGYVPNFTALNAEKQAMTPKFEAQTRNQQAFDVLNGMNQQNAVIGPDYEKPNYGQINDQFDKDNKPAAGVDMSWTNGAYSPGSQQQPGVYNPQPRPFNNFRWGP